MEVERQTHSGDKIETTLEPFQKVNCSNVENIQDVYITSSYCQDINQNRVNGHEHFLFKEANPKYRTFDDCIQRPNCRVFSSTRYEWYQNDISIFISIYTKRKVSLSFALFYCSLFYLLCCFVLLKTIDVDIPFWALKRSHFRKFRTLRACLYEAGWPD